jgi:hypothetical protein
MCSMPRRHAQVSGLLRALVCPCARAHCCLLNLQSPRSVPLRSPTASSEMCLVPPAELEALASELDESQALQPDSQSEVPVPPPPENGTSSVEADVEARMFSLHAAAQHPYGRRLGDRLYGDSSAYAAVPGAAISSPPPTPLAVMGPPPAPATSMSLAPGGNGPPLSPPRAPPPLLSPPPSVAQPIPPLLPPPPAATPGMPSNATAPWTRAASPWQLNAASIAALVALLLTATCGAVLLVCRASRQRQQDGQLCHAQMEGLPHVLWRENALAGEGEEEEGMPGGRTSL